LEPERARVTRALSSSCVRYFGEVRPLFIIPFSLIERGCAIISIDFQFCHPPVQNS
jgi:hypothetical protein